MSVASDGCQVIECDGVGAKAAEPLPVGELSYGIINSTAAVTAAAC